LLKSADQGDYKYTAEDLAALTHMANRYEAAKGEAMKLSSQMFVEKFQGAETLAQDLFTNLKTGVEGSRKDHAERIRVYGANAFPPPKLKSLWELVAENFEDTINQILCGAAVVSIVIGLIQHGFPEGLIEGTSILIALNIIIVVNSGNNWLSEKRLADLVKLSDRQEVAVFRGSEKAVTLDSEELVVGDLVLIEAGMKVPADMVLVSG
jgi:magnesium-transporting ATPase (P-type)